MVLSSLVSTTLLSDKLVEQCAETIKNEDKCSSCIFYMVLLSIFLNHDKENVSKYDYVYQTKNYYINGRS